jgi:hypothetical protein
MTRNSGKSRSCAKAFSRSSDEINADPGALILVNGAPGDNGGHQAPQQF